MANWWFVQPPFRQFLSIAPAGVATTAPIRPPVALVGAPAIVAVIPAVAASAVAAIVPAPIAAVIVATVPAAPADIHLLFAFSVVAAGLDNGRGCLAGQSAAQKGWVSAGGKWSCEKNKGEKHRQFQSLTHF